MVPEPAQVVAKLAQVFDTLGIRYVVGGSFASSVYGIPRATQDADFVADLRLDDADRIAQALAGEFYVDAEMIRDAIQRKATFNGDEVSDRQWNDVLGVLKIQGELLDREYLKFWAAVLDVSELLDRARRKPL